MKDIFVFLLIFVNIDLIVSQFQCPDNLQYESVVGCDPEGINACSAGFRCRPANSFGTGGAGIGTGNLNNNGIIGGINATTSTSLGKIQYLCCSTENMTISDYFVESGLSPTAIPIIPLGPVKGVVMRDNLTAQLASIEGVGADFAPNIGVIPNGLTILQVGTFSILDTVAFDYPPAEGGFLHFLVAIDPLYIPSAIFLYYNYPSFGESVFNLTESNQRFDRGYNFIIGNATILQQTQYKQHFVVLVFRTMQAIENETQIEEDLMGSRGDLAFFLSTTFTGEILDAPVLGTLFRLRTPSTIFQTSNSTNTYDSSGIEPLNFTMGDKRTGNDLAVASVLQRYAFCQKRSAKFKY